MQIFYEKYRIICKYRKKVVILQRKIVKTIVR